MNDVQEQARKVVEKMFGGIVYTFHRADGFYPLALKNDEDALTNALCNPGTLKVVNEFTGVTVFDSSTHFN